MTKNEILAILSNLKDELGLRFGVRRLALFGSVARDAMSEESDIDLLVSFDCAATSTKFFGVQFLLEDALGRSVDLVTETSIRPELRTTIESDLLDVFSDIPLLIEECLQIEKDLSAE